MGRSTERFPVITRDFANKEGRVVEKAAGRLAEKLAGDKDPGRIFGIAVLGILLLVYLVSWLGFSLVDAPGWLSLILLVVFALMIAAQVFRRTIEARLVSVRSFVEPILCIFLILAGFFLLEQPYNHSLFAMPFGFVMLNLAIVSLVFGIIYFAGQRSRLSAILFLALCLFVGVANYFVIRFKGQPIIPVDLLALETAAAVSEGYRYAIDSSVVVAFIVFVLAASMASFLSGVRLKVKSTVMSLGASLLCVAAFSYFFISPDIEEAYGCKLDSWDIRWSYETQGSLLCFLEMTDSVEPAVPQGYSTERAEEILSSYQDDPKTTTETTSKPSVVVVMNEAFSDLSTYQVLSKEVSEPSYYHSIAEEALSGKAYTSVVGGGTCNSEFEFLTGSSMANLGAAVYPYVNYDLSTVEALPSYFKGLGYRTTAIHPDVSRNWRRDALYPGFGFDEFVDIEGFPNAEYLRISVTDRECYRKVLDRLSSSDDPQFIFNITMQNHGGYSTGLVPDDLRVSADLPSVEDEGNAELNEYLSCLQQSDKDLRYLIEGLQELDEEVILCFFGDHQPKIVDWLAELELGKATSEFAIEEVQLRYNTPYFIWSNRAASNKAASEDVSLNYLGAVLAETTGLPLTGYQKFLLDMREKMPVLNLNGYQDKGGKWFWTEEESAALGAYRDYAVVQYRRLFDK